MVEGFDMSVIFDDRWLGPHGIGRFAAEVGKRIGHDGINLAGAPMSPVDPLRLALHLQKVGQGKMFLSPGYNAPLWSSTPFVFTIHDLNHLDRPENSSVAKRMYYERLLKPACRRSAAILTVSEFSRQRIADWSGVEAGKITNVGNGVDPIYCPDGPRHSPGYGYVLCVGNRKLHKNEVRALRAFAAATLPASWHLVLTGSPSPELQACAASLGLEDRVVFIGHVAEAELPALYRGAAALLFPSLYEGFGLPVVEAFACGTPVVTSNATSLPEIAGNAALLVDPLSVQAIGAALTQVAGDERLRGVLRERGLQRARAFAWPEVGRRVWTVLQAVAQRSGLPPPPLVTDSSA